ncbi:MAG: response regulator transcription factor [Treponema sp.]|nr:response regulator transcription factor [Treponema sp.]
MRILLINDDLRTSQGLAEFLQRSQAGVDVVYTTEEGIECANSQIYDIVILDISHSQEKSLLLVDQLRKAGNSVPLLMLSSLTETDDIVEALDAGADDYLKKPFDLAELAARVRALTRRKGELKEDKISYGDLFLNKSTCEIQNQKGDSTRLSLKEFSILELLLESKNNVLKKEKIIEKIWGGNSDAEYNNVEVYISFLRKKMEQLGIRTKIRTFRGIGYSLELS